MPTTKTDLQPVFEKLRGILKKYEKHLTVVTDKPGEYYVDAGYSEQWKKNVCFGVAKVQKNYVSFHLMAVYGCPALLDGFSPELKKRMQGKSCFNFASVDPALFQELAALTKAGFEVYKKQGWV
jgi:hypothetical protein